jgi:DNA-binding IclR family transcriptional regulator
VRNEAAEVVAALGISAYGSTVSLGDLVAQTPHVLSIADHVSARLGYRRESELAAA